VSDTADEGRQRRLRPPNPIRLVVLWIGLGLARAGIIDRQRAVETTELAWPRIVTGIARMSKNAVDVAMVGVAVGTTAVAGVGLAGPFWGAAFAIGGGVAGGTIALVSQRYGAEVYDELGLAVRASTVLAVVLTLPVAMLFWLFPYDLVSLLSDDPAVIDYGATYLQIVGLGVPLAALNLVGSRVLVGADDAYSAMQLRASGALINIALNAILIFGLGLGVTGAALGTVLSNVVVTAAFAIGLSRGRLPGIGALPVQINVTDTYLHVSTLRDLVDIGLPVGLRNGVWVAAEFPMLLIVGWYGDATLAAFVIARRIWGVMNAPGWGFGLASSSLVGQSLGEGDEQTAEAYGKEIVQFAVATYAVSAITVALLADQVVVLFADDPNSPALPIATELVYAACVAIVFQGVAGASAGPLDASGDTRVPFLSQLFGMACVSIPLAYLGATTSLGLWGLYLAFLAETSIPATINYWRFQTNKWKRISEDYRPDAALADD
jgi:putative MATE family efflux protein